MSGLRVCLLLLLATTLSCSAAPPPVYDTEGHELSTNASYYILPANRGYGGGLKAVAEHKLSRWPLFISQEVHNTALGFPVHFTPYDGAASTAGDLTVRLSTDVRISHSIVTLSVQKTDWHVDNGELHRHVVTGPFTYPTWSAFRVEKYIGTEVRGYKLMACQDKCVDLGVFRGIEGGVNWLLAGKEPAHVVVFQKAPTKC